MRVRLRDSIDNLYTVFGKYHGNPKMKGSPVYGHLDTWNSCLFSRRLNELDEEDLFRFTGKAMTTWGEVEDYKHFLPRIFELTALYKTPYEIWIAFEKLECGDWQNWNIKEQEVIHEYMIALFENLLHDESENAKWNFPDYFIALGRFYPNFMLLLEMWDTTNTKASIIHLTKFIINEVHPIFDKGNFDGFKILDEQMEELKNWLLRPKLKTEIEQAYFKFEKEEFAEELSWAEQILNNQSKLISGNN